MTHPKLDARGNFEVITAERQRAEPGKVIVTALAGLFFLICTWTSYARWANFQYRSFDLAYYVQAIWQLIHGRLDVSVENVPLLGNHVEPIVFLFAPLFAVFRHPMLFVIVQNAALATMPLVGYNIAKRLGLDGKRACLLSAALLLAPAAGYIAIHEFHPEALVAPFLLLMLQAWVAKSISRHWLWFVAVLACKENMAPLLIVYCATLCVAERSRGLAVLRRWFLWPMGLALIWFVLCAYVITPALNSGNIDYVALYDQLGTSPENILINAVVRPQLIGSALLQSLTHGNLVLGLLLPFLCLPLLRPRWIVIAAPILLQHLLSWRSSEWMIYFHYAAPLLPLFWIASVEAIAAFDQRKHVPSFVSRVAAWLVIIGCAGAQVWIGPVSRIVTTTADWFEAGQDRARKNAFIAQIPPASSVVAPLPYLSHLAMREKLYSLHYILKGLKTLGRSSYQPPSATDFVLIDYRDSATFDPGAGFYHPTMKTVEGRIVPSSDRLLHDFLKGAVWTADEQDELTLLQNLGSRKTPVGEQSSPDNEAGVFSIGATRLISIATAGEVVSRSRPLEVQLRWRFQGERNVFPWMLLRLSREKAKVALLVKGLCAPEATEGIYTETWRVVTAEHLLPGDYSLEALFVDNSKRGWFETNRSGGGESTLLSAPVSLGHIKVEQ
ncbi:MAG: hypothetical protein DME29_00590 [Verrucomicrobia bacterium]|nr:MAG: hypothetical protein DME29_00590 [Verrucomicrobiota bacterium]